MRAVFFREDAPETPVGEAVWTARGVEVQAEDERVRASLQRVFRPSPVVIDDPSLRSYGTSGPTVLNPGTVMWFRAAAEARGKAEGLQARLVPEGREAMGWDPAGAYRTFWKAIERREQIGRT